MDDTLKTPSAPTQDLVTQGAQPIADRAVRSMTVEGSFRLITVRTTDLVQEIVRHQKVQGASARILGDLVTATVIIRETMAPGFRVQAVLSQDEQGSYVADSHPPVSDSTVGALTRGLSTHGDSVPAATHLGSTSVLKVVRSLPGGELHQSIISAEGRDVSNAIMEYLQSSAQIVAMCGMTTIVDGDRVIASGGYLLQLLPDCDRNLLAVMTERLAHDFADLAPRLAEHDALCEHLTTEIFYGMPFAELAASRLRFGCDCDDARMMTAVASLGLEELNGIVASGEIIDLHCEYCQKHYKIGPEQLRPLLVAN